MTKVGLHAIGKSTTLESNKSHNQLHLIADFRRLKVTHKGAHVLDGVTDTRKLYCEVFFRCLWSLQKVIALAYHAALPGF